MLARAIRKELKKSFKNDFNFSVSKEKGVDFESNLIFLLSNKEKLGLEGARTKYKPILKEIFGRFGLGNDFEISKRGFLNIRLNKNVLIEELKKLLDKKEDYFKSKEFSKKINLEFVSANPTGPLHLGNLRGGPIGEVLANLLKNQGAEITKEYYVNDLGNQVDLFVDSVLHYLDKDKYKFPPKGYKGDYPKFIAKILRKSHFKGDRGALKRKIIDLVLKDIKKELSILGIYFDSFIFESDLAEKTKEVLEKLRAKKVVKEKDGALWFYSPEHKQLMGDRECVLVRSSGEPTYFLNDIAYHINKFERGFDLLIDIWGANHFGHAPRILAALEVLGYPKDSIKIIFYQPVSLKKKGKALMMSKRKGSIIRLKDVLEGVDKDVFKTFLFQKTLNSPLEFEIDKFEEEKKKSISFYIKYMSARIEGILRKVREPKVVPSFSELDESAFNLIKEIIFLDYKSLCSVEILEPHLYYEEAIKFCEAFHSFYEKNPIKNEKNVNLRQARFEVLKAARITLRYISTILGVSLPKRM